MGRLVRYHLVTVNTLLKEGILQYLHDIISVGDVVCFVRPQMRRTLGYTDSNYSSALACACVGTFVSVSLFCRNII
jgi:hypothetical protein